MPSYPATETKPLEEQQQQQTDCEKNPERAGCKQLGSAPADDTLASQSVVPTSITPVSLTLNNACPANVGLPHGLSFSWQPACDYASGLRPVILALAWRAAGFILLGARTDG